MLSAMANSRLPQFQMSLPVLVPRDTLILRDSSPDVPGLDSGITVPGRMVLRWNSTRNGIARQRNGIYMLRWGSLEGAWL